jgi:hypothetical protein
MSSGEETNADGRADVVDQHLLCADCSEEFQFSAGEQLFFRDRDLSPPKRCKACREIRRSAYGRSRW